MAVIRVEKNGNYTTMCNVHLRDKSISLKAKGLLSQMLSLPDSWEYSVAGLVKINQEGENGIISILRELKEAGYVQVRRYNPNETKSGRFEYEYTVYEVPPKTDTQKQGHCINGIVSMALNQQHCDNGIERGAYINNRDESLNGSTNSNNRSNNRHSQFVPPTLEEVKAYCSERNSSVDPKTFFDYFNEGNWHDSEGKPVRNWKQKLLTWESKGGRHGERKGDMAKAESKWAWVDHPI